MKKLLSLLGAAGLFLAAGSSVMSFTYLDNAAQSTSTTTASDIASIRDIKDINDVITTPDLGVVGSLDSRLETKGGAVPYYYGMTQENLIPFMAESNPELYKGRLQGMVRLEQSTWNEFTQVSTNKVRIIGIEGTVNVTFRVVVSTSQAIRQPQLGAFVTRNQNGEHLDVIADMIINRLIALNGQNLPKNIDKTTIHYHQLPILDGTYGEVRIDNFFGPTIVTWDAVQLPKTINTNVEISEISEAAIVNAFRDANPALDDLFYLPNTQTMRFVSEDAATITFRVGKDVLLVAVVHFQLVR